MKFLFILLLISTECLNHESSTPGVPSFFRRGRSRYFFCNCFLAGSVTNSTNVSYSEQCEWSENNEKVQERSTQTWTISHRWLVERRRGEWNRQRKQKSKLDWCTRYCKLLLGINSCNRDNALPSCELELLRSEIFIIYKENFRAQFTQRSTRKPCRGWMSMQMEFREFLKPI